MAAGEQGGNEAEKEAGAKQSINTLTNIRIL